MKKVILAAFITAAALSQVQAADTATKGTITFNGKVVAQTCTLKGEDPYNKLVELPTVSTTQLDSVGNEAGATPFSIELTKCSAAGNGITQVYANFNVPQTNVTPEGYLRNTSSADNVAVALYKNDGSTWIDLRPAAVAQASKDAAVPLDTGSVSLDYVAKYRAVGGAAEAGDVSSSVQFDLAYL